MKNHSIIFLLLACLACSKKAEKNASSDTTATMPYTAQAVKQPVQAKEMGDTTYGVLDIDGHQLEFTPIEESEYKKYYRSGDKDESNCEEFGGDCEAALDNYYAQKYANTMTRSGPTLSVRIRNGKQVDFTTDTSISEGGTQYYYRGQLKSGFHIIQEIYLEGSGYTLVNINTGERTKIWGMPVESPDHKRVIVYSFDLMAGYNSNDLQLFKIQNGNMVKEWEKEFSTWGPNLPYWQDNQTVYLKQGTQGSQGDVLYTYSAMKIINK
ncbi:MAG TPA: hypothetical protein VNW99_00500 [Cytophagaceae bacterium]|jgi:hypothetical protein|nr:hypothetical protein [Cytophagaceae bacterium]